MANKSIKDAFQRFWEYVTAKVDEQKTVVVNVTEDASGTFTADMTYEEIVEAINAGKDCKAHLKEYGDNSNGSFLSLVRDLTGQYPYVEFTGTSGSYINYTSVAVHMGGTVSCYTDRTWSNPTDGYYLRRIKYSETAETPTTEGDICFKLK